MWSLGPKILQGCQVGTIRWSYSHLPLKLVACMHTHTHTQTNRKEYFWNFFHIERLIGLLHVRFEGKVKIMGFE